MQRYVKNCRIVSLPPSAKTPVNLTPEFYSALDPDISSDGYYIIFSGKKNPQDYWQIWRMKADGSEKTQITKEAGDCVMPVFAGNRFYLDDPQPTPQIIYAGTAHCWKNNLEDGPVYALYGTDHQGKVIRRLTFNLYSDFSPDVLPNGRIVFSSMQPSYERITPSLKLAFFAINNDGTDLMPFFGNHEPPVYKSDIRISHEDQRIYFIESDKTDFLGGGNIAYLSQRRPLHSYKKISQTAVGYYKSPAPLPGDGLLASYRTNHMDSVYALYTVNTATGECAKKIYGTTEWHCLDAQILAPYQPVKGKSNWLIPGAVNGVFYCLNSYQTNQDRATKINQGDFKFVRVIEGLAIDKDKSGPENSNLTPFAPARILGIAPVEEDGSFHVRVPAEIPVSFQMLDTHKMVLDRQKTWTWVIGNENRGCIGCHENKELSPENKLVKAITKPAVDLTTQVKERRTVDFKNQIAALIQKKCATSQCHISGKALPVFETKQSFDVYNTLLQPIQDRTQEHYVLPGYAKQSPLIWHLFGKKLVNENIAYSSKISQMPPENPLSEEEKLLIIEWIDMGAHWDLLSTDYISKD
ncbi:MAG: hypothetical protein KDF60_19685 [Calditrichaeota bacterium]|nr:hypothetical protein [Calditrichota bacterium]